MHFSAYLVKSHESSRTWNFGAKSNYIISWVAENMIKMNTLILHNIFAFIRQSPKVKKILAA